MSATVGWSDELNNRDQVMAEGNAVDELPTQACREIDVAKYAHDGPPSTGNVNSPPDALPGRLAVATV